MSKILRAARRGGASKEPYLIDTDVIIYYLSGMYSAQLLVERLFSSGVAISVVSYMEVMDGIIDSADYHVTHPRFMALVQGSLLLDVTRTEAERCASLRSSLRQQGRRIRPRALDLMIAATALEHNMTLVTNNPGDYDDISGLTVEPARIVSDG